MHGSGSGSGSVQVGQWPMTKSRGATLAMSRGPREREEAIDFTSDRRTIGSSSSSPQKSKSKGGKRRTAGKSSAGQGSGFDQIGHVMVYTGGVKSKP